MTILYWQIALLIVLVGALLYYLMRWRERALRRQLFRLEEKIRDEGRLREDFTSMIVHDLKAPLDGIQKVIRLLQGKRLKGKEEREEFMGLIYKNASNMLLLVNDLLDAARMKEGRYPVTPVEGSPAGLFQEQEHLFRPLFHEKKITLLIEHGSGFPTFAFDSRRIAQVVNNFLSNTLKYTNPGGTVRLQTFLHGEGKDILEEAKALHVHWPYAATGELGLSLPESFIISVTDTAGGIPDEKLQHLFTKFQRLHRPEGGHEEGGTGLGLVIVKGIIEAHGGQVGVWSILGEGTTFWATIPLAQMTAPTT